MCGHLPTTPSVLLPQRVAHDSDANVRVVICRAPNSGMRTPTYPASPKKFVMPQFTIPGLSARQGGEVAKLLQKQLGTYNDLHLL